MDDLLADAESSRPYRPLADRMRPTTLDEFLVSSTCWPKAVH